MTTAPVLLFAPSPADVPDVQPLPAPPAVQRPLFYDPPPAPRPLRLVRRVLAAVAPGRPFDRVRDRPDGSTVACRVTRAPADAPAAWLVRIVVSTRRHGAPAKTHSRMLYAPTAAAALAAQAAAMLALDAAYDAAAERLPPPVLYLVRPDDVEPHAAGVGVRTPSGHDHDDGAPSRAAG